MRSLDRLHAALRRLPGVGPKQAERLALHLLRASPAEVTELADAMRGAKSAIGLCDGCLDYTEGDLCALCRDESRDASLLCVVSEPSDLRAVHRTGFRGFFHVLHGSLAPLEGVGPEKLKIRELLEKVKNASGRVHEVILATDPDTEGEATAIYLAGLLKPLGVRCTRIAHGVPLGGDLDYIDEATLAHSLAGRKEI